MKKFVKVLSLVLTIALTLAIGAAASIYFPRLAGMRTFTGRIEDFGAAADDPQLVLAVGDVNAGYFVGNEGDVSGDGVVFPVLADAYNEAGSTDWRDSNGKEAVAAPVFTLSTINGDVNDAYLRIELGGDISAAEAMRFGITTKYYEEGSDQWYREDGLSREIDGNTNVSEVVSLGDIAEGERVEIYVSAWVAEYELGNIDYQGGDMTVDVVFSAEGVEE